MKIDLGPIMSVLIVALVTIVSGIAISKSSEKVCPSEMTYQEYLPVRNEYIVIHPKGTDDMIEIFIREPYKWDVCINGLNHCQEVTIR